MSGAVIDLAERAVRKADAKVLRDSAAIARQALLVVYERANELLTPAEKHALSVVREACAEIEDGNR